MCLLASEHDLYAPVTVTPCKHCFIFCRFGHHPHFYQVRGSFQSNQQEPEETVGCEQDTRMADSWQPASCFRETHDSAFHSFPTQAAKPQGEPKENGWQPKPATLGASFPSSGQAAPGAASRRFEPSFRAPTKTL